LSGGVGCRDTLKTGPTDATFIASVQPRLDSFRLRTSAVSATDCSV
jgi:hypothetical protein